MTVRLSHSSFTGTERTEVAVGTLRDASMFCAVRAGAPRSTVYVGSSFAAGARRAWGPSRPARWCPARVRRPRRSCAASRPGRGRPACWSSASLVVSAGCLSAGCSACFPWACSGGSGAGCSGCSRPGPAGVPAGPVGPRRTVGVPVRLEVAHPLRIHAVRIALVLLEHLLDEPLVGSELGGGVGRTGGLGTAALVVSPLPVVRACGITVKASPTRQQMRSRCPDLGQGERETPTHQTQGVTSMSSDPDTTPVRRRPGAASVAISATASQRRATSRAEQRPGRDAGRPERRPDARGRAGRRVRRGRRPAAPKGPRPGRGRRVRDRRRASSRRPTSRATTRAPTSAAPSRASPTGAAAVARRDRDGADQPADRGADRRGHPDPLRVKVDVLAVGGGPSAATAHVGLALPDLRQGHQARRRAGPAAAHQARRRLEGLRLRPDQGSPLMSDTSPTAAAHPRPGPRARRGGARRPRQRRATGRAEPGEAEGRRRRRRRRRRGLDPRRRLRRPPGRER